MNKPHIIAIIGAAGSGKTTVSRFLQQDFIFKRFRFAGKLKEMLHVLGLSWDQLDGNKKETPSDLLFGKTPRYAMQTLGTEWRDMINPNLWTKVLEQELIEHINAPGLDKEGEEPRPVLIVIDDCRFPHEVEMLKKLGAEIWCIRRAKVEPGVVARMVSKLYEPFRSMVSFALGIKPIHPSELLWMDIDPDVTIYNNHSEPELLATVEAALYERRHGAFERNTT